MFDSDPNSSWMPDMVDFFTPRGKSDNSFSKKVLSPNKHKQRRKSKLSVGNISSDFGNKNEFSENSEISNGTGSKKKRKRELSVDNDTKNEESFSKKKKKQELNGDISYINRSNEVTNTSLGSVEKKKRKRKRKSENSNVSSQSIKQEIVNDSFKNEETLSFVSRKKKKIKREGKNIVKGPDILISSKQVAKNDSCSDERNKSANSTEKKKGKKKKSKLLSPDSSFVNESDSKESEEEQDDENSTNFKKSKRKDVNKIARQGDSQPDDAQKSRTVFFGNLPNTWTKDRFLKKISKRYGKLEMSTFKFKHANIAKNSDNSIVEKKPEILHAVVRFVNKNSAVKAVNDNGIVFSDHHVRINMAHEDIVQDRNKSVFIGNIPRTTNEDELWKLFESCGKIRSIRILRDVHTGNSKNVAYVNFESTDSVELALSLDGETLKERELRVQRCMTRERKRKEKRKNKKLKKISTDSVLQQNKKKLPSIENITTFQGETSSKKQKKKKKLNKEEQRKRMLVKKLAPSVKQPHKIKHKPV